MAQPLLDAAITGNIGRVKELLHNGENIMQVDAEGESVMSLAAKHGHLELVKYPR